MATVDVIIPAFNSAKYLPMALESVAAQTFPDWRIILVNDGSTDDTHDIVGPFIERFGPKLKYIRQENRGLPAARNAAILASDSEFLALLDSDDVWLPCRLAESLDAFQSRPNAGLAYGLITFIDADNNQSTSFAGNRTHSEGRIAPYIYMRKVELPCPTITFRRSCIDEVGVFDEEMRATEDRDLWLRIALRYEVIAIRKVIALYRVSSGSMSSDPERMFKAQIRFLDKNYGSEGCGWLPRQIATARAYKQLAVGYKEKRRQWSALATALKAVAIFPFDKENLIAAASILRDTIRKPRTRA